MDSQKSISHLQSLSAASCHAIFVKGKAGSSTSAQILSVTTELSSTNKLIFKTGNPAGDNA